jgi:DNA topoisomerase IA
MRKEQSPKNALAPSLTAFVVCKLLEQYFPDFVDTQFTARMEDALDQIATGAANKTDYLSQVCFLHTYTVIVYAIYIECSNTEPFARLYVVLHC